MNTVVDGPSAPASVLVDEDLHSRLAAGCGNQRLTGEPPSAAGSPALGAEISRLGSWRAYLGRAAAAEVA